MILPLQKFSVLIESMAAGVQGGSAQLVDISIGSVLRALIESCAAVALWMQWLILQVLSVTRASTSTGSDLDSWMADFGLTRLSGSPGGGQVTFARYTAGTGATVPAGTQVYTTDRSRVFKVTVQPENPAWNGVNGYTVAASISGIVLPVQAVTPGGGGNILPGSIGWLTTAVPGIDTVSNLQGFVGGVDAEGDDAFRARFQLYINSRSQCTVGAVQYAIASLRQGLRYAVLENVNTANLPQVGNFWVVVDDGTGTPPATLISSASEVITAIRPIGSTYAVTGPSILNANVEMYITTSDPTTLTSVQAAIQIAIASWTQSLPISGTLAISKLDTIAHNADPSVVSVIATTINGSPTDIVASAGQVIVPVSIVVN